MTWLQRDRVRRSVREPEDRPLADARNSQGAGGKQRRGQAGRQAREAVPQ
jgi:hypothetical protein